jgi:hypothetical protein
MWDDLKDYWDGLTPGPLEETSRLADLLARVWAQLVGGDEAAMAGWKLTRGRGMEKAEWHPPVLTFRIERHGGTVLGSTRAELQGWAVDLDQRSATCMGKAGHRQLYPRAKPVKAQPIADVLIELIDRRGIDDRIRWLSDVRVRVEMGKIFPDGPPKDTVRGRRSSLREKLIEMLGEKGWKQDHRNVNTFVKVDPQAK